MENQVDLMAIVNRIKESNSKSTKDKPVTKYACEVCKDTGLVQTDTKAYRRCTCIERDKVNKSWRDSGLTNEQLEKKTFGNFHGWNNDIQKMKDKASSYAITFPKIQGTDQHSLYLSGTPGCGKSHLAIGTAVALMKMKFNITYMPYMEVALQLKQNAMNQEVYNKLLNKYKVADVLLIDDLLKGQPTQADLNILFQIIDYRYRTKLPMIVSSERPITSVLNWDQAIGRRLYEMCKGHIVQVDDVKNNYSLRKD